MEKKNFQFSIRTPHGYLLTSCSGHKIYLKHNNWIFYLVSIHYKYIKVLKTNEINIYNYTSEEQF